MNNTNVCETYQSLLLLLLSTPDHIREVHQGPGHVVTFGLLIGVLVLGLEGSGCSFNDNMCIKHHRQR